MSQGKRRLRTLSSFPHLKARASPHAGPQTWAPGKRSMALQTPKEWNWVPVTRDLVKLEPQLICMRNFLWP